MTLVEPIMPIIDGESVTPMMAQYFEIKRAHPDCLLFYRMGDFYEMFFDDAIAAARALDIALTKRGRHEGREIPMCGVPVATAESYLARLIKLGFRVAVAEQTEDPAEARRRGSKSLVRRDVIRVVTPGTLTEDALLEPRRNNYLAALADAEGQLGFAWLDISTGEFRTQPVGADRLNLVLARLEPGELLLPERLFSREDLRGAVNDFDGLPTPDSQFDSENGRKRLAAYYKVQTLDGFGDFTRAEIAAAGALLDYLALTQKGRLPRLAPPKRLAAGAAMEIDPATARNLELFRTLSGERKGSLIATIDKTVTAAGARLLASRLALPLTDVGHIRARLDMVEYFFSDADLRAAARELLGESPDIERALSRLSLFRGGPRDLANVCDALSIAHRLRKLLTSSRVTLPADLNLCAEKLGQHDTLIEILSRALASDLPVIAREGGFIAAGYAPALDEQRSLRDESRRLIARLQNRYQTATGISSLRIRHNNVLGFYIEVPPGQASKMPQASFIHRQTLASAVRYTTTELADLESRIARAAETALGIELDLFAELTAQVLANSDSITRAAHALAELDVGSALADLAVSSRYVRPAIDGTKNFRITGGRHPVVEASLAANNDSPFVANDCALSAEEGNAEEGVAPRIWLLTGPNMAGKSTFLRQNALIAILAQIGSFVPAQDAKIGIVDRLFSRVGAADDLARGRSTFMVEMLETAAILNQAGPRALVILDEIGRGTATFDGLSIAWAVVEHLHGVNRCRALFATHYHELTALSATLPGLGLYTMRVKEWQGQVVFLHEVAKGAADRSYGIHVAELAGLPPPVIARAGQVLESLERGRKAQALANLAEDLPLFSATAKEETPNPALEVLDSVNPDALSPREALDLLYTLKATLAESSKH